ncbi:hypothetical protein O181_132457 [Austropuccinia psidii MF-1]|uniref:Reverse transcriptase Ty1/copia-type domain-containing protein n=1 Tax=Austropuccinia psidii MF-1 TaxID=1389203 RepID=A0A9Q3L7B7_9BASI|nr:hypothetical protein [Austropuccinia psidii MF-1]
MEGPPLTADIYAPCTILQALQSDQSRHWRSASEAELQKFEKRDVWEAVNPIANMKILGEKWVFIVQRTESGAIDNFNARYASRGFSQRPGIYCSDVYAPTASLNSLWLLLEMKLKFNLHMEVFDISAAYLYSPIEEDVLVQAPLELQPDLTCKVIKLNKNPHRKK